MPNKKYTTDYYKLLNICYPSSKEEIKAAYRTFAKIFHPDIRGTNDQMYLINEAYECLSNDIKKAEYDRWYIENITDVKVVANILYSDKGYVQESLSASKIIADYKKYQDENGEIYILVHQINGQPRRTIVFKDEWLRVFFENERIHYRPNSGTETKGTATTSQTHQPEQSARELVPAYFLDILKGIWMEEIDAARLPANYRQYLSEEKIAYLFYDLTPEGKKLKITYQKEWEKLARKFHFTPPKRSVNAKPKYDFSKIFEKAKIIAGVALLLAGVLYMFYGNNTTKEIAKPKPIVSPTPSPTPLPQQPLPVHNTTSIYYDQYDYILAPLTINTSPGGYYYLKLVNADDKATVCQTVFIHGGQTAEIEVPIGNYIVRWVSGDKWYGEEYLFNNNSAQEADELFEFTYDNEYVWGHTLTLYPVTNGNLETKTIDISQF